MKRMILGLVLAAATAFAPSALAQGTITQSVTELINAGGYEIIGVIPSSAGPGILLQWESGGQTVLIMCFVAETPESATIATQYCKPVV